MSVMAGSRSGSKCEDVSYLNEDIGDRFPALRTEPIVGRKFYHSCAVHKENASAATMSPAACEGPN